jgi:hypothetical protein
MRNKTSNGMAGLKRQGMQLNALRSLAALALLGWGANRASAALAVGTLTQQVSSTVASGSTISQSPQAGSDVAAGTAVNLVVSSGSGGGGAMAPFTPLALLTLLIVGWWRTRSAFLLSEQETETESRDPVP